MKDSENTVIYAAGAVLWRFDAKKNVEIALIHRPRYDDWSLPKGKLDPNETMIGCAHREVMEETGYSAIFGPEIGHVTYMVDGTTKLAKYWSAQAVGEPTGKPNPQEVDEILWLSPADARKKLTLDDDRSIVDFFCEFGTGTTPLVLLRHAKAIKRGKIGMAMMAIAPWPMLDRSKLNAFYQSICPMEYKWSTPLMQCDVSKLSSQ